MTNKVYVYKVSLRFHVCMLHPLAMANLLIRPPCYFGHFIVARTKDYAFIFSKKTQSCQTVAGNNVPFTVVLFVLSPAKRRGTP